MTVYRRESPARKRAIIGKQRKFNFLMVLLDLNQFSNSCCNGMNTMLEKLNVLTANKSGIDKVTGTNSIYIHCLIGRL